MDQQKSKLLYLTILLLLESGLNQPTLAQSNESELISPETIELEALPKPPKTPPDNNTRPGGGLDPNNQQSCHSENQSLRALVPSSNNINNLLETNTISDQPTFLFYIPDVSSDLKYVQFSLNNQEEETIYRGDFIVPETPGIVSLTVPSLTSDQFINKQYYHWYFKVYCANNNSEQSNFYVEGWIKKIDTENNPSWYDFSSNIYQQILINPEDNLLREQWHNLLQFIEQEDLIDQEISGELIPTAFNN